MTEPFHMVLPGQPVSWQRPRAGRSNNGKPFFFEARKVAAWRDYIRNEAADILKGKPMFGCDPRHPKPLTVLVEFYMERPKRLYREKDPDHPILKETRPDLDNLYKGVMDALQGVVFRDDALIAEAVIRKYYHSKEGGPEVAITTKEVGH